MTEMNQDQLETLKSALAAFRDGNLPLSKETCTGLLRQVPDEPGALRLLGQIQYFEGNVEEAAKLLEQSLKQKREQYSMWVKLGNMYSDMNQQKKADKTYSEAIKHSNDSHLAYFWRAQSRAVLGKTKKAWEDLSEAAKLNPLFAQTYRLMQVLGHPDATTHAWATAIEEKLNLRRFERPDMIQARYALAGYYELKKDFENMWRHLNAANGLQKNQAIQWQATYAGTIERVRKDFTPELLKKTVAAKHKKITPVFIVGIPRSGSTLLEAMLTAHPEVFGAGEVQFMPTVLKRLQREMTLLDYPNGLEALSTKDLEGLSAQYQDPLKKMAGKAPFATDKLLSNSYLVGLIYLLMPWAKVIHMTRDPLDTAYSIYKNFFWEKISPELCSLSDIGEYTRLSDKIMAFWKELLPDFVIDVSYEDLVKNPEQSMKKVVKFCGLPWDQTLMEKRGTGAQTLSIAQIQQPLYESSIGQAKQFEEKMTPFLEALKKT